MMKATTTTVTVTTNRKVMMTMLADTDSKNLKATGVISITVKTREPMKSWSLKTTIMRCQTLRRAASASYRGEGKLRNKSRVAMVSKYLY